jgi:hypothetical protein
MEALRRPELQAACPNFEQVLRYALVAQLLGRKT